MTMTTTRRETKAEKIARKALEYDALRDQADDILAQAAVIQEEILGLTQPGEPAECDYDNQHVRVSHVQKFSEYMDEAKLRKSLPTAVWNKISRRKVDPALLKVAIDDEVITPQQITEVTERVPQKPYILVTTKKLG